MGRHKSGLQGDEGTNTLRHYFIPVTDELRQLANELSTIFEDLLSSKESITRDGLEIKKSISWCKKLVVVKTHEESKTNALASLSYLGVRKNEAFPSTPEEYYQRCRQRDNVQRVKAAEAPLSTILCDVGLRRLPLDNLLSLSPGGQYSREYRLDEVLEQAQHDPQSVTIADLNKVLPGSPVDITKEDVIQHKYGRDPLEKLTGLCHKNDADTEMLIFLEHYLPNELAEVIRDLSRTHRDACRVDASLVSFLSEFHRSFSTFEIIRTSLVRTNLDLPKLIDEAHGKLFLLSAAVRETASPELPHKIAIFARGDDLEFTVDGKPVCLTPTQREALVALALLGNNRAFTVKKFAALAPSEKSKADHNFENKIKLLRVVLPRLKFESVWGGNRLLKNVIFVDVPSDELLEQSLYGGLGADE